MPMIERIEEVISELKRLQLVLEDELSVLDINWLHSVMSRLSSIRPVFHSEAEFKEHLDGQLSGEGFDVHMEHPFSPGKVDKPSTQRKASGARNALDIWLPDKGVAIELKYRKQALECSWKDETFHLKPGGAVDQTRYDFLKDVERLENLELPRYRVGFSVLLTNEPLLWKKRSGGKETFDENFRLHDEDRDENIEECLEWIKKNGKGPSSGTTSDGRDESICLRGSYFPEWNDCRDLAKETDWKDCSSKKPKHGLFRYLAFQVNPESKGAMP